MAGSKGGRSRPAAILSIVALGLSPLVAGCGPGPGPGPAATTPVETTVTTSVEPIEPTVTADITPTAPRGEIWEWALGRNAWTDPALAQLAASLGRSSSTNIMAHAHGFELDLDDAGAVVAVVLYNDETALGLPASESSFQAYAGSLPGGLSWQDTYDTVVGRHGPGEQQTGGSGVEYTFSYETRDGHRLDVTFAARHQSDLPGSRLHTVTVRAATG